MPVYHVTLHAFNSWTPENPRGYYQHGKGWKPPSPGLARKRNSTARWDAARFDWELHDRLIELSLDIAHRRRWKIHAEMVNETHIHIVVSMRSVDTKGDVVQATFKRLLGLFLARITKIAGRRWFSDGGKPVRVKDLKHLNHLKYSYLPEHLGTLWLEDYLAR